MPPTALIAAQQPGDDVTQSGWDVFIDVATQITILAGILSLLAYLLWPRLRDALQDVTQTRKDATETRKQISETNDGKHARDVLNRIESKLDRNTRRIDSVDEDLRAHIRQHRGRED